MAGKRAQLRNVLMSARALAGDSRIDKFHLSLNSFGADPAHFAPPTRPGETATGDPANTLRELERQGILRTLRDFSGNRSQAGRALGIDRSRLRSKLAQ